MRCMWVVVAAIAALPYMAGAQTLAPSTQDRQQIATLTYRANLPGTSAADRAALARQITELEYRINTRPLIAPLPTIAPDWNTGLATGAVPPAAGAANAPMGPSIYGSCDGDRAVVSYLDQQLMLPSTTGQEREYARARRAELQKDLHSRGC